MRLSAKKHMSQLETATVLSNMRAPNSREMLVGRDGDINAGSKQELMQRLIEIAGMIDKGDLSNQAETANTMTSAERREILIEAMQDQGGQKFAELGSDIGLEITDRVSRAGFARRLFARADVAQGSIPRVKVRRRDVQAVVATGPTQVGIQMVRDEYLYPSEFYITFNLRVEQKDITQGSADILEQKLNDGLENVLVKEDKLVKKLMDNGSTISNDIQYWSGAFTPSVAANLQYQVQRWSLPAVNMILAMDLLKDITTATTFSEYFDPVSKLEIVLTGKIGNLLGMEITTDGYRDPNLRVLNNGEVYVTTVPDHLGGYTDRGPIQTTPKDYTEDTPSRGWYGFEQMSLALGNTRGVAKGSRL